MQGGVHIDNQGVTADILAGSSESQSQPPLAHLLRQNQTHVHKSTAVHRIVHTSEGWKNGASFMPACITFHRFSIAPQKTTMIFHVR